MNYYDKSVEIEEAGQKDIRIIYQIEWPDIIRVEDIRGKDPQYHGIDHLVHLPGNVAIPTQAKIRDTGYEDVLLEYISNDVTETPGWMEIPSLAKHFFYLIRPKKKCYRFLWADLQALWNANKDEWKRFGEQKINGFRRVQAKNVGYYTISVAVPIKRVLDEIEGETIYYG